MKKPAALPDTNFILRYLLHDVEEQFMEADDFFEKVRTGTASALIAESVLVECLYILTKYYAVTRADSATNLTALLQYKGIANKEKGTLIRCLAIFAGSSLDPVDCVLAARAEVAGNQVMTLDKALKKQCKLPP